MGGRPDFKNFCSEVLDSCVSEGQRGPLEQRLDLLRQFVKESDENVTLKEEQDDLQNLVGSGVRIPSEGVRGTTQQRVAASHTLSRCSLVYFPA